MDQVRLEKAAMKSLQNEHFGRPAEVSIVLVDDKRMHELNKAYRSIDRPTDVLSFAQLDDENVPVDVTIPVGDIVVSTDTAERQAVSGGRSLNDELEILVIHGMLHLLGYDDETDEGADEMREHEKEILSKIHDGTKTG